MYLKNSSYNYNGTLQFDTSLYNFLQGELVPCGLRTKHSNDGELRRGGMKEKN